MQRGMFTFLNVIFSKNDEKHILQVTLNTIFSKNDEKHILQGVIYNILLS